MSVTYEDDWEELRRTLPDPEDPLVAMGRENQATSVETPAKNPLEGSEWELLLRTLGWRKKDVGWELRAQRNATGAASSWEEVNVNQEEVSHTDPEEVSHIDLEEEEVSHIDPEEEEVSHIDPEEEGEAVGGEAVEGEAEGAQGHVIPALPSSTPPTPVLATDWSRYFHWEAGSYWWHSPSIGGWMYEYEIPFVMLPGIDGQIWWWSNCGVHLSSPPQTAEEAREVAAAIAANNQRA